MINNYVVYEHTNTINGKKYIGITCQNPIDRWSNGNGYKHNQHFTMAIQKYGWDKFDHKILYERLTKEEACQIEKRLIQELQLTNPKYGYNLDGGGSAPSRSEETKRKISKTLKEKSKTDEWKRKRSETAYKIWQSESYRQLMKEINSGKNNKRAKQVICVQTGEIFDTAREASLNMGYDKTAVTSAIHKNHKCGGYHWRYLSN